MARRQQRDKASRRDWALTVPASAGLVSTMLSFELPLRAIGRWGQPHEVMDAGQFLAKVLWSCFRMTGASMVVEGREHLTRGERYLIMANHQGFSDVIVLSNVLREYAPRYVAKRELAYGWPSISYMLRASGSAVIDRKHPEDAIAEIERLGRDAQREGWSTAIFPEGTRAKDGVLGRWKMGGAKALVDTVGGCRVLPVSLSGGSDFFAYGGLPFKSGVELHCKIHPPVDSPEAEGQSHEDFADWLEGVRQTVAGGVVGA